MLSWYDVLDYIDSEEEYEDLDFYEDSKFNIVKADFSNVIDGQRGYGVISLKKDRKNKNAQWIKISSPIGELTPKEVEYVLKNVSRFFIGGLCKIKDKYFCCSSIKLSSLNEENFYENVYKVISASISLINELDKD